MPVTITDTRTDRKNYLIPAPFVNITKNFDKQGDGEIIGATYSITLTGTLLADRGSPLNHLGIDTLGIKADVLAGKRTGFIDDQIMTTLVSRAAPCNYKDYIHGHCGAENLGEEHYRALQVKQKALLNMFSKLNEGALLEVSPPEESMDPDVDGFKAFVKFESIDIPAHNPGDPVKSQYTINLKADYLVGPNGQIDQEDWENLGRWLVSSASETWDIAEIDGKHVIERADGTTAYERNAFNRNDNAYEDMSRDMHNGEAVAHHKVYTLTHTISSTGKSKFDRTANNAAGIPGHKIMDAGNYIESGSIENQNGENVTTGTSSTRSIKDGFSSMYAPNGRAWQQARGFVYDVIKYGERFLAGDNGAFVDNAASTTLKTNSTKTSEVDYDNYDTFGMNLPKKADGSHIYKAYNYKRTQNVDKRGGSFSVTETWTLAPEDFLALETFDVSVSESDQAGGIIEVSINGTIEGLLNNAVDNSATDNNTTDDKEKSMLTDTTQDSRETHVDITGKGTEKAVELPEPDHGVMVYSKHENAKLHYNTKVQPNLYNTAQKMVDDLFGYEQIGYAGVDDGDTWTDKGLIVNPLPVNKSITQQPGTGTITYNFTFSTKPIGNIPFCNNENISVSTNYPGMVVAQHQVIGRPLGPVLQSLGTQTAATRSLSLSCNVDVRRKYLCVDNKYYTVHPYSNSDACTAAKGPEGQSLIWIKNPNYVNTRASIHGTATAGTNYDALRPRATEAMSSARPSTQRNSYWGDTTVEPNKTYKLSQHNGIAQIVSSFDPFAYRTLYDSANKNYNAHYREHGVRKSYHDAPSESWDPTTGAWSYSITWTYEMDDPYTQPSATYLNGLNADASASPWPGDEM